MRNLLFIPIIVILLAACTTEDTSDVWTNYKDWRNENIEWLNQQVQLKNPDGSSYYSVVVPQWDNSAYVLMHWFNDTTQTSENLSPLYTSTVAVKYVGKLYTDTIFDSSYSLADSLFVTTPGNVISGWTIALTNMHVGDSVDVVIPYEQAYYTQSQGLILPFSVLQFGIKLVDIPYYEAKP